MKVSIIIATRNRADALEQISLPSLAKQDFKDFEVIIWDASDNDKSKIVVENFIQSHPDMIVRYFKAPRVGLASQRNDAVKVAKGDIIFFIDDDSEVSSDGLSALNETFNIKDIVGVALPLKSTNILYNGVRAIVIKVILKIFFMGNMTSTKSRVYLSGQCDDQFQFSGYVAHMAGGDMAFKREVFKDHYFEEGLQRFGGYALYEDVQFTQKLYREGKKLFISDHGYVFHHQAEGGRLQQDAYFAADIYNRFIVWKTAVYPFKKYSIIFYLWSLFGTIILYSLAYLRHPKKNKYRFRGLRKGLKAIVFR